MSKRRGLLVAGITALIAWTALAAVLAAGWTPKLGLDLQGGFSIRLTAPDGTDEDVLDTAVDIIRRRIEALGNVQEPEIAPAGDRSIEIQLPGVTDRQRALDAVGTTGDLTFRPVLDIGPAPGVSPIFQQLGVEPGEEAAADPNWPENVDPETGLTIIDDPGTDSYLLEDESLLIYHTAPAVLEGKDIAGGEVAFNAGLGGSGWAVDPEFTASGNEIFRQVTGELAAQPFGSPTRAFAIVLDGGVVSAPTVNADVLPGEGLDPRQAVITIGGSESPEDDARNLATVLKYGALPTTFEVDRVQAVSATLGSDSLRAGLLAGIGGLILVGIYMMFYYRGLGLVTVVGLTIFGSILLVVFGLLGEWQGLTLTLAGATGVIVAIGITSDSYIVYFERIKEEVHEGRSLRAAADVAFPRAFRTILTADFVSLVGSIILYLLAEGAVRGFALALGIATVADVFIAWFYTRPATAFIVRSSIGEGGAVSVRAAVGHPAEVRSS